MHDVIVVNRIAKRLRSDRRLRIQIHDRFVREAIVVDEDGARLVDTRLRQISLDQRIDRVFVAGGDGTYNVVLNWIAKRPPDNQPALMSVGGGEFCYMTRFHGWRSKNPVTNLRAIYERGVSLEKRDWRPLLIYNTSTNDRRYAVVVANGIVTDLMRWYEAIGKGGIGTVVSIVTLAGLSVLAEWIRRWIGRIKGAKGTVQMDDQQWTHPSYAGLAVSAIPELLASCRPFRGEPAGDQFYSNLYWGSLRRLPFAAPFLWFGKMPFWIKRYTHNQPVGFASFATDDPFLVVDGDLCRLRAAIDEKHILRHHVEIRRAAPIPILTVVPR